MSYYVIESATSGLCIKQKRLGVVKGVFSNKLQALDNADIRNNTRAKNSSVVYSVHTVTSAKKLFRLEV